MKPNAKAIAALLGAISTWGVTAAADDAITLVELFGLLGVLGTAVATWAVPNAPHVVVRRVRQLRADRGASDLALIVAVLILAVALVLAFGDCTAP